MMRWSSHGVLRTRANLWRHWRLEITNTIAVTRICINTPNRNSPIPNGIPSSLRQDKQLVLHRMTEHHPDESCKKGPSQANDSTHTVIATLWCCNSHEYEARQPSDSEVVLEMKNPISNYPVEWTTLGRSESRDASYPLATISNLKSNELWRMPTPAGSSLTTSWSWRTIKLLHITASTHCR